MNTYYLFCRGDDYQVTVGVDEHGFVTFHKIITPENTPNEVETKFLEDAEAAALKKHYSKSEAV